MLFDIRNGGLMAKFIYRLQNVLNIKYRLETQAKTAYAQALAKLSEEEAKFNELVSRRKAYEEELRQAGSDRLVLSKMQKLSEAIEVMKELIKHQYLNVKVAQKNVDAARARLNTAMQERKIYEKLKENAFEDFKLEIAAEEKKEIDELVSFTYNDSGSEDD